MHSSGVTTLYHGERSDGTGSSLQNMLHTAAYAARRGWRYGGIIRNHGAGSLGQLLCGRNSNCARAAIRAPERMTGHAQPFDPAVEAFFGSAAALVHQALPEHDSSGAVVITLKRKYTVGQGSGLLIAEMMARLEAVDDSRNVTAVVLPAYALDLNSLTSGSSTFDEFYTAPFRAALRASAACSLSQHSQWFFQADRPAVALHVRRGDVTLARHPGRFTDDSYYYGIADVIRRYLPSADFHVFSSTRDQFSRGERNNTIENFRARSVLHPSKSFDGFRQRGMAVHLDGDPNVASAHLMAARIVVLAKSAFSWVPAVFNAHCVVYHTFSTKPLGHWAVADSLTNLSKTLPACIGEVGLSPP